MHGLRVLVDPALEPRIGVRLGPLVFGPKRRVAPALGTRELGGVDLLLLTHAHMDHLDLGTLRHLPRETPVVIPTGLRDLVRRFRDVTELRWGEQWQRDGTTVTLVPTKHWGARTVWDRHRSWGGYVLERHGAARVLFAGDTAETDLLDPLASANLDVAVLPIGAYDPWIWNHCSPEQAWGIFGRVGARWMLPVHHATFRLSREPRVEEPLERLLAAAGAEGRARIALTEIGEQFEVPPRD